MILKFRVYGYGELIANGEIVANGEQEAREQLQQYYPGCPRVDLTEVSLSHGICSNCGHDWTAHGPFIASGLMICEEASHDTTTA